MDGISEYIESAIERGVITPMEYLRARVQYMDVLSKAEGSRGGHIAGHTKSGKPIYGVFKHDAANGGRYYHKNAIEYFKHEKVAQKHADKLNEKEMVHVVRSSNYVVDFPKSDSIEKATKSQVIKTASGKVIQDSFAHKDHEDFDAQDHLDAAKHHAKLYAAKKNIKDSHAAMRHFMAHAEKKGGEELKHSLEQLVAHVEQTSEKRLKEVAKNHSNQHLRDLASRELERRKPKPTKGKP